MKELALYLVQQLADHPERVTVRESEQGGTVTLRVGVADEDKGKVIGKQGKVIKAIRAVVSAAAAKAGKRTSLDLD